MDVNAWLTKRINTFRPNERDGDQLIIGNSPRNKSGTREDNKSRENLMEELDHYRCRVHQLRDESNALYKDLITLRRNKSEYFEWINRENNGAIMELICDIYRAKDEISMLEAVLDCSQLDESQKDQLGMIGRREDFSNSEEPETCHQQEVRNALQTLGVIVSKLKEQSANFHNYVTVIGDMQSEGMTYDSLLQNSAGDFNRRSKVCDSLLRELGIRTN